MSVTVKVPPNQILPDGTAVGAYLKRETEVERNEGRQPTPNPAATGVISGGEVTLSGLEEGKQYELVGFVDEIQEVKVDATAGQQKTTFEGQQTSNVAYNASATVYREALEALSTVGAGNVEVTGGPGNSGGTTPYKVKFIGSLAGKNVGAMTVANGTTPLSGGGAAATVTTKTQGSKAGEGGIQRYVLFTA